MIPYLLAVLYFIWGVFVRPEDFYWWIFMTNVMLGVSLGVAVADRNTRRRRERNEELLRTLTELSSNYEHYMRDINR